MLLVECDDYQSKGTYRSGFAAVKSPCLWTRNFTAKLRCLLRLVLTVRGRKSDQLLVRHISDTCDTRGFKASLASWGPVKGWSWFGIMVEHGWTMLNLTSSYFVMLILRCVVMSGGRQSWSKWLGRAALMEIGVLMEVDHRDSHHRWTLHRLGKCIIQIHTCFMFRR